MRRALLLVLLLGCAGPVRAESQERADFPWTGVWYVLIHYRDAAAASPDTWRWEDRVWDFQQRQGTVVWTDYELVTFMNVTGRFTNLRTSRARRLEGRWEPDQGQRREIERGLFVNPRGSHVFALRPDASGWRSDVDVAGRPQAGFAVGLARSGSVRRAGGLPRFAIEEVLDAPGAPNRLVRTVFEAEGPGPDDELRGRYESGARRGRFRMLPTRLRGRGRPEVGPSATGVLMKPDTIGQWGNFLPALVRPWHYFPERELAIDSTPPGAFLDLAYLRDGARRLFEQTRAPARVRLPSRFVASASDVLEIRAFAPGFQTARRDVLVHGEERAVSIELEPSANVVREVWYRSFDARATLTLFSDLPTALRSAQDGATLTLLLPNTALGEGVGSRLAAISSGAVHSLRARQIGEDLLLRLERGDPEEPVRFLVGSDPIREHERTVIAFGADDASAAWRRRVDGALAALGPASVDACALAFERALREGLDPEDLAWALSGGDRTARPLVRAALARLGEIARDGAVRVAGGPALDPSRRLDLEAAALDAPRVEGLLAALRAVGARLRAGDPAEGLRSLVAPASTAVDFEPLLRAAERAERRCAPPAAASR